MEAIEAPDRLWGRDAEDLPRRLAEKSLIICNAPQGTTILGRRITKEGS